MYARGGEGCTFRSAGVSAAVALAAAALVALQAWWACRKPSDPHRAYVGDAQAAPGQSPWRRWRWLQRRGGGGRTGGGRPPRGARGGGGEGGGEGAGIVVANGEGGGAAGALVRGAAYPSGPWRGYYRQAGCEHGVATFNLAFAADGALTGAGKRVGRIFRGGGGGGGPTGAKRKILKGL
jgi:hypothetical protein